MVIALFNYVDTVPPLPALHALAYRGAFASSSSDRSTTNNSGALSRFRHTAPLPFADDPEAPSLLQLSTR